MGFLRTRGLLYSDGDGAAAESMPTSDDGAGTREQEDGRWNLVVSSFERLLSRG